MGNTLNCFKQMSTGNPRNKVALKPGFSQMHWMMKVQSDRNLSGRGGKPPRAIRMEEVALHASEDDAWTVYRGKVFNITPYLHYHPGGVEILLQGAGKDCTELFNLYHKWINAEAFIGSLYLGDLVEEPVAVISQPSMPPPSSNIKEMKGGDAQQELVGAEEADDDVKLHWVDVADANVLIEEDSRLLVQVPTEGDTMNDGGRWVALVRCDGELHAIDATCYHMGGPLLFADIEDIDVKLPKQVSSGGGAHKSKIKKEACLNCPWHHYKIRLSDGHRLHLVSGNKYEASEEPKQRKHKVKEENQRVYVHLMDKVETGGLEEVASDNYAYKKPAPAQKGRASNRRSGQVLNKSKGVKAGVLDSMKGSDGVAPWMASNTGVEEEEAGEAESEEDRTVIGYEFQPPSLSKSKHNGMMLSSHFSIFTLDSYTDAGKDMKLMKFKCLPSLRSSLAFRGRHVDVRAEMKYFYDNGEEDDEIVRPYTPIIRPDEFGEFSLLVKGYQQGMLSKHLVFNMKIGDSIEMRGPFGGIAPLWLERKDNEKKQGLRLLLLGAGTGLTPCLQLIFGILSKAKTCLDVQDVTLITFNRTEQEIPMREEVDSLGLQNGPNIQVIHALSSPPSSWQGLTGRVSEEMLLPYLKAPLNEQKSQESAAELQDNSTDERSDDNVRIGFCGPDGFHMTMRKIVKSLNIDPSSCHEFC